MEAIVRKSRVDSVTLFQSGKNTRGEVRDKVEK